MSGAHAGAASAGRACAGEARALANKIALPYPILLYAAFIAGLCSIIYELLIATTAAYFLGGSVVYFSLTIGMYMASMGVGSFVSKYMEQNLLVKFIGAELLLGLCGGISIPVLYFAYAQDVFLPFYVFFTVAIGFLIGLEIPFLTRLMQNFAGLKSNIAHILSLDYLGAVAATLAFPFLLLPFLGLYQTSLAFGLINMTIAFVLCWSFKQLAGNQGKKLAVLTLGLSALLGALMLFSSQALRLWDDRLYADRVVYAKQTAHQRIILTKHKEDIRLFLDGNLQFSSLDEYRYHESLIHVPMGMHASLVRRALLLGAGDGMALRELLKYPAIEEVTLVDLDAAVIRLGQSNPYLRRLNRNSFDSPKLRVVTGDALTYLHDAKNCFDFIVSDLPDPNNEALARLYSLQFYRLVRKRLCQGGLFVTQATSPYFATKAFWSIVKTIEAAGFAHVLPYHTQVPSFGEWGFVMALPRQSDLKEAEISVETRFLDKRNLASLFVFAKDLQTGDVQVNRLDRPIVLHYYLDGWRYYSR